MKFKYLCNFNVIQKAFKAFCPWLKMDAFLNFFQPFFKNSSKEIYGPISDVFSRMSVLHYLWHWEMEVNHELLVFNKVLVGVEDGHVYGVHPFFGYWLGYGKSLCTAGITCFLWSFLQFVVWWNFWRCTINPAKGFGDHGVTMLFLLIFRKIGSRWRCAWVHPANLDTIARAVFELSCLTFTWSVCAILCSL